MTPSVCIGTHNLMHGLRLGSLIPHYVALRDEHGLGLLCLQEDRFLSENRHLPSARIAAALGPDWQVVCADACRGLAFVLDARTLACDAVAAEPLPLLAGLNAFERTYIVGGKTNQKYVLLADLRARAGGAPFAAACFHLDTAGGNAHRAKQVAAIAAALRARGRQDRFVACGDSNAFAWRRQPEALRRLLQPLAALGAADPETAPTHYFARQHEPKLPHRIGVLLGKLGIDMPRRYDVVFTNLPVAARGHVVTPDSDHDLVWARVDLEPEKCPKRLTAGLPGD